MLVDTGDADELARVAAFVEEIVDDALAREHGDQLDLMTAIKAVFDPHGIMNPGKVLPE